MRHRSDRLIAVVAAYALAVNLLMSALAAAAVTSAGETAFGTLCSGDQSGGGDVPADHGRDCPLGLACVSHGCAGMAGHVARGELAPARQPAAAKLAGEPAGIEIPALPVIGSHAARAPPLPGHRSQ